MDAALAYTLTRQYGTPQYAYDLGAVQARAGELFSLLPEGAEVCFSLKSNPLPAIARRLRLGGCRAEITSTGELAAALAAGFSGERMLFGGPGKTDEELDAALRAGIRLFSSESFRDLVALSAACGRHGCQAGVLLRVNPAEAPDARLAMTGVESQFGFAEPLLLEPGARERVLLPGLEFQGVHIYFGTQVAGVEALATNTRRALECAQRVEAALGLECRIINAGGGFPWPYASDHAPQPLTGLCEALTEAWQTSPASRRGTALWFEAGRFLCAGSGWLLARVLEVKTFPTRDFVILDTGIHHLGGMAGLGRVPRGAVTLVNLSRDTSALPPMTADLVGPLCTPLDALARGVKIPPVEPGDLVGIPNVGAYGVTASLLGFLSHPPPVEVAHEAGRVVEAWRLRHGHECVTQG
jgi:diaminopimelate decarboxylase